MLLSMQQPLPETPPSISPSFAGSLAEIAFPEKKFPPVRDLDGLADDVAVFSYEQALRRQSPSFPTRPAAGHEADSASNHGPGIPPSRSATVPIPKEQSLSAASASPAPGKRQSSVTIRLSAQENQQLHLRALEAGLTVSAYVRSCAFEVESLRAEVKATLAQLRSHSPFPHPASPTVNHESTVASPVRRFQIRSWLQFLPDFLTRSTRHKPRA